MVGENFQSTRSDLETTHVSWTIHAALISRYVEWCYLLHVDDMLGTGDELFESKLKELDKLVGFGQYEKHANGEITISMKAHIQNSRKADRTLEGTKQLDDELSASESHEFRGVNGCLRKVTKD